jgi:regulator of protease activity HflC (stomatin/prohibitin superfamily)
MTSLLLSGVLLAVVVVFAINSVKVVPQTQNYLVERLGRYNRTLEAGLHLIIPIVESVRSRVSILERQLDTRRISTITLDNVTISIDLAILYRISDASRAFYRVLDVDQAIQTTVIGMVRSVIGRTDLDGVQSNRRELSEAIESELRSVSQEWGIVLTRVEIIDVEVDSETRAAMQLQLNSERTRRALVREAEGKKEAAQLAADAELYSAQRLAEAKRTLAEAEAFAIGVVSASIANGGQAAIDFEVRKVNAEAIKTIGAANSAKIVVIPSDVIDSFSRAVAKIAS